VTAAARNRALVQQLFQAMANNPEYAEMQDLISRALATAQSVNDQTSLAMADPEQFGHGKTWQTDAASAQSNARAMESKLEKSLIPANGTSPAEVSAWWKTLGPATQVQLVKNEPALIGALNGLPAMVRDKANRIVLTDSIAQDKQLQASLPAQEKQVEAEITQLEADGKDVYPLDPAIPSPPMTMLTNQLNSIKTRLAGASSQLAALTNLQNELDARSIPWGPGHKPTPLPPMYLLGFNTDASGHAIVACGDPDTAKNVAVYVPGLNTSSNGTHFQYDVLHTENMTMQADADTGTNDNATVIWLGYNAPQIPASSLTHDLDVAGTQDATQAVPDLTSFVNTIHTLNKNLTNYTLVGHSYGSLVVGEAAKASKLPVNNIVLLGSPGAGVNHASDLNINPSHVWAGAAPGDPIAKLGRFGPSPTSSDFGAKVIKVDATSGLSTQAHGEYFDTYGNINNDTGQSSLDNIASIIAGQYNHVTYGTGRRSVL
jgi:pimeloyl-ACP methyl ester carboxylesterase